MLSIPKGMTSERVFIPEHTEPISLHVRYWNASIVQFIPYLAASRSIMKITNYRL